MLEVLTPLVGTQTKTQLDSPAPPARMARTLPHLLTRHACLWAALGLLAALAFGPSPAQAAVTEAWVQRYNGPANNSDNRAKAVAVDASGNVVVTGYSSDIFGNTDYYTAKYAAAYGALLWEHRYNGPANGFDSASSLALGPNGLVAVTGYSTGNSGYFDYATVVYREPSEFRITSQAVGADGRFRLSFTTTNYSSYFILYRGTEVANIHQPVDATLGPLEFQLSDPTPVSAQATAFYRIRAVPLAQPLDSDADGIDDVYELRHPRFLNPFNPADAALDYDGDGWPNLDEYWNGTDPATPPAAQGTPHK